MSSRHQTGDLHSIMPSENENDDKNNQIEKNTESPQSVTSGTK